LDFSARLRAAQTEQRVGFMDGGTPSQAKNAVIFCRGLGGFSPNK